MDDPNSADFWRHKARNMRATAQFMTHQAARKLIEEIADRYDALAKIVEREPIVRVRSRA